MNKSESVKQIFAALVKAQEDLKNSFKSATNPHFRSKYAPLDEIINGIKPVLSKYGLAITQDVSGAAYRDWETDRKSTRLNSSHSGESRMPSSA